MKPDYTLVLASAPYKKRPGCYVVGYVFNNVAAGKHFYKKQELELAGKVRMIFPPKPRLFLVDEGWFEYKNAKLKQVDPARAENLCRARIIPETRFKNKAKLIAALEKGK